MELAEYLNGLNNGNVVSGSAIPVMVTLARKTYFGAQYLRIGDTCDSFYLLGTPPYQRNGHSKRVCFVTPAISYELFIAGHATQETADDPRYASYHSFGAWFSLMQWAFEDSKIDTYESTPYQRKPITIINL